MPPSLLVCHQAVGGHGAAELTAVQHNGLIQPSRPDKQGVGQDLGKRACQQTWTSGKPQDITIATTDSRDRKVECAADDRVLWRCSNEVIAERAEIFLLNKEAGIGWHDADERLEAAIVSVGVIPTFREQKREPKKVGFLGRLPCAAVGRHDILRIVFAQEVLR